MERFLKKYTMLKIIESFMHKKVTFNLIHIPYYLFFYFINDFLKWTLNYTIFEIFINF